MNIKLHKVISKNKLFPSLLYLINKFFSDIQENLAWATAQIHCYCNSTLQDNKPDSVLNSTKIETSLNVTNKGQGDVVLATNPKILFCDLRLAPGETKSCEFLLFQTK